MKIFPISEHFPRNPPGQTNFAMVPKEPFSFLSFPTAAGILMRGGNWIVCFVLYAVCCSFRLLLQILLRMIKIPFIFFYCNFRELEMSEDIRAVLSFNWGRWGAACNHNKQIGDDNNDVPTFIRDCIDFGSLTYLYFYSHLPCRIFCSDFMCSPQFEMNLLPRPISAHLLLFSVSCQTKPTLSSTRDS